ncbi:MAG TPA: hypothetical protein VMH30_10155 [Verrucomicrobiae bacterium]|nr:hypothetical protein [Verrucomicrobiae bacterium]
MNEFESNSGLADQVATLQRQIFLLLLAMIVVSGTLVAYLLYQSHHIGKDVKSLQTQVIQPYYQKLPTIKKFVGELIAYGNQHPEFRPILVKYGIVTNAPPPKK